MSCSLMVSRQLEGVLLGGLGWAPRDPLGGLSYVFSITGIRQQSTVTSCDSLSSEKAFHGNRARVPSTGESAYDRA